MSEPGPTVFNKRYELLRHIARGGMADVYLARDQLLDRQVALKVLFPEFANDASFVERFRREAQAAANLNHPNIVGIHDWGQERGTYYIVMEHVSGRSMADVLRSTGPLSPDRAAEIAADVASALGTAHAAGVVHRDVKLGNILVSDDGVVKVTDFGIATAFANRASTDLTQHGSVMGTAAYFSPEQAQGKPVDGRSDLYSLGVVLYEMLAGVPPFQAETAVAVAYMHVQTPPQNLRRRGVNVAESLDAITMKLLAKRPADRYPSADDLRRDLRRYLSGAHKVTRAQDGAAPRPAGGPPQSPGAGSSVPALPDAPGQAPPTALAPQTQAGAPPAPPAGGGGGPAPYGYEFDGYEFGGVPPRSSSGGVWRTVAVVAVLAVLVTVLAYLIVAFARALGGDDDPETGDDVEDVVLVDVPNLVGSDVGDARESIVELGLDFDVEFEANDTVPANEVFAQSPPPGQRVEPGSAVVLRVSNGSEQTVPNVIGETQESATTILQELGYSVSITTATSPSDAGTVVGQDPGVGAHRAPGETIELTVSTGIDLVPIPDTKGKSITAAINALNAVGFVVTGEPLEEASPIAADGTLEVEEGHVIRTEPQADELRAAATPVQLVVSTGFPTVLVPQLTGAAADSAMQSLRNVSLVPEAVYEDLQAGDANIGKVISQSPAASSEVELNSQVTLTIGRLDPTPSTSSTTTTTTTTTVPATSSSTTTTTTSTTVPSDDG